MTETEPFTGSQLDRVKEVKVRIPVSYHIKLHSMKVLTGKAISDAVTEALATYFASERDEGLVDHVPVHDIDDARKGGLMSQ